MTFHFYWSTTKYNLGPAFEGVCHGESWVDAKTLEVAMELVKKGLADGNIYVKDEDLVLDDGNAPQKIIP